MNAWSLVALHAGLVLAAPAHAASADQRFEALYAKEWAWRQEQFAGYDNEDAAASAKDDHLPAVDAASQRRRLAYWTDVLAQLDAIPAGSHLHVHISKLHYIDHACMDALYSWQKQHETLGSTIFVEWDHLLAKQQPPRVQAESTQTVSARGRV